MTVAWRQTRRGRQGVADDLPSYQEKFLHLLIKRTDIECWTLDIGTELSSLHKYATFGWRDPNDPTSKRKSYMARKVSYEIFIGPIPKITDCVLVTTCKNVGCVNPEHLKLATKGEISKLSRIKYNGAFNDYK